MKKTKKVKRYQEEGLVTEAIEDTPEGIQTLKKEGLAAAKRDPQEKGFFAGLKRLGTRFTEGNIDDPRSIAYKKYGAGRGLAERNKNIPIEDRSFKPDASAPKPDVSVLNPVEANRKATDSGSSYTNANNAILGKTGAGSSDYTSQEGMSGIDRTTDLKPRPDKKPPPNKRKKPPPKKVSYSEKEANQDLDREIKRAQRAAPKTSELEKEAEARDKKRKALLATALAATGVALGGAALRKNIKKGSRDDNRSAYSSSGGRNPRLMGIDPMMEADLERMAGEGGRNFKKGGKAKANPIKKYASGGSVSGASKRADGCAVRGKTKGRIV